MHMKHHIMCLKAASLSLQGAHMSHMIHMYRCVRKCMDNPSHLPFHPNHSLLTCLHRIRLHAYGSDRDPNDAK